MSMRQQLNDPERKHWATRAENPFDEGSGARFKPWVLRDGRDSRTPWTLALK